jgi:hypothetical protein
VLVKEIRMIQGKKASNDLKMSLEAMGHRQVQGPWGMKFEADRTGATGKLLCVDYCSYFNAFLLHN